MLQIGTGGVGAWGGVFLLPSAGRGSWAPPGAFMEVVLGSKVRRTLLRRSTRLPRDARAEMTKWKNPQSKKERKTRGALLGKDQHPLPPNVAASAFGARRSALSLFLSRTSFQ